MRQRISIVAVLLIITGVGLASLPQDWIEETIGFEPDGRRGILELLIAVIPIVAGVALLAVTIVRSPRRARHVAARRREV